MDAAPHDSAVLGSPVWLQLRIGRVHARRRGVLRHGQDGLQRHQAHPRHARRGLHYTRFTDLVDDTIDARVWQGLHFREADVQGAGIGKDAARWLAKHFFQPVK